MCVCMYVFVCMCVCVCVRVCVCACTHTQMHTRTLELEASYPEMMPSRGCGHSCLSIIDEDRWWYKNALKNPVSLERSDGKWHTQKACQVEVPKCAE